MYRVSFSKPGCEYTRSFDTATERDKFTESMKSGLLPVWKQTIIFQIIKKAVAVAITSTYQP